MIRHGALLATQGERAGSLAHDRSNTASELVNGFGNAMCPSRHQSIRLMISPADTDRPQPGCLSHLHVKGGVPNEYRILGRHSCCRECLKEHPGVGFGGRHISGLNGPKKAVPSQRFQRGSDGVRPVPGRDAQNGIRSRTQLIQKVANPAEWLFGKCGICPQLRQQEIVGPDHLKYRSCRAGELGQNDTKRLSDQRKTVGGRRGRQLKFRKYDSMALQNQRAAVDQCAVEIEYD